MVVFFASKWQCFKTAPKEKLGMPDIMHKITGNRKFSFDVERAIFLTVLHRLFASGSDRACEKWKEDYHVERTELLALHQLYRAMSFLGEEIKDQKNKTPFSPRCHKDLIEECLSERRQDLFSGLDLVFFDTTSIYSSLEQTESKNEYDPCLSQFQENEPHTFFRFQKIFLSTFDQLLD